MSCSFYPKILPGFSIQKESAPDLPWYCFTKNKNADEDDFEPLLVSSEFEKLKCKGKDFYFKESEFRKIEGSKNLDSTVIHEKMLSLAVQKSSFPFHFSLFNPPSSSVQFVVSPCTINMEMATNHDNNQSRRGFARIILY